jgi:hypothetical protein
MAELFFARTTRTLWSFIRLAQRRLLILTLVFHVSLYFFRPSSAFSAEPLFKADGSCTRSFVYRNRTYPLDSSRKLDGEGLRTVFKNVPQSEALLNNYQSKLQSSAIPAYVATLGVALAVGGPIYANTLDSHLGQRDTRYGFLLSGVLLAVASYAYGQFAIVQKENVLEKAINNYNDSVPNAERIRVDVGPLPDGSGGEIRTQVPF